MASYQGVIARQDVVLFLCVVWFLVTYYPLLSLALIACLLVTTFWQRSVAGARVFVNYITGSFKKTKGHLGRNLAIAQSRVPGEFENDQTRLIDENEEIGRHKETV